MVLNVSNQSNTNQRFAWLEGLKAFALLAILMNHFVEEIWSSYPWFTNPSANWPDLQTRLSQVFPKGDSLVLSSMKFIGWLGDAGPGAFIVASGIGLAWSHFHHDKQNWNTFQFYQRRLSRLLPLYITMHFVFFAAALLISKSTLTVASPNSLLSLLGLRFTDELFFYISPSWWFMWLILQLYLIFPFLIKQLEAHGLKKFLLTTFVFSFLSRLAGLIGIRYSDSLYFWMTGIFFGTRLAEFTAGMAIAYVLYHNKNKRPILATKSILPVSLVIYLVGFVSSLFYFGSIFSNLMVSLGLSGLFFYLFKIGIEKISLMRKLVLWIGKESYSIYLFHQVPLMALGGFISNNRSMYVLTAVIVLIGSFPAGWMINRLVVQTINMARKIVNTNMNRYVSATVSCGALMVLLVHTKINVDSRVIAFICGMLVIYLAYVEGKITLAEGNSEQIVRRMAICVLFTKLFMFPVGKGLKLSLIVGILSAVFITALQRKLKSRILIWSLGVAAAVVIMSVGELFLLHFAPLEAGRWGEYPVLMAHETRLYALKPNQHRRLRYNNYNYVVKTNSFGLSSPEIKSERSDDETFRLLVVGDAFSMPEGLEFEKSYPALLQNHLGGAAHSINIEVINGGVTGYGPVEESTQLKELAKVFKPEVAIYQFFIDEFGQVNATRKGRLEGIGINDGEMGAIRRQITGLQIDAHLDKWLNSTREKLTGKPAGWRYDKALLRYYRKGDNPIYSSHNLKEMKKYLSGMHLFCMRNDIFFIVYFVPGAVSVCKSKDLKYLPWGIDLNNNKTYDLDLPFRHLQRICSDIGVPLVDLSHALRDFPDQPVYFSESWHWNEHGHRAAAQSIAEDLLNRGLIGANKRRSLSLKNFNN